jgi:hypothetical protein|tara:strand:- start:251 stop:454 length:204 start_codon:yes stop_codon:yes gene_type:complete
MINRYIEDQRLYITVGSDATEVECDLSFDSIEIPCTIMDGPLMGFEIMLDRAFILRKAREEQGEDVY